MQHKLKYINLFEELSQSEIQYSRYDYSRKLHINFHRLSKYIPPVFNRITTEITGSISIDNTKIENITGFNRLQSVGGYLSISHNPVLETVTGLDQLQSVRGSLDIWDNTALQSVTGFEQLQSIGYRLSINYNTGLQSVTGFDQLQSIGSSLLIGNNPNLVTLSIPSTLIRSVNYKDYYIVFEDDHKFKSPEEFVNSELTIQDCIDKFDPGLHSDIVVKQIVENVELWGSDGTKEKIYSFIAPQCNPEQLNMIPDTYKHLYHSDFNNTGAKSVAKVATGVTYGLF